jgi:hypothetical protein
VPPRRTRASASTPIAIRKLLKATERTGGRHPIPGLRAPGAVKLPKRLYWKAGRPFAVGLVKDPSGQVLVAAVPLTLARLLARLRSRSA